jgi:hypothetical protein
MDKWQNIETNGIIGMFIAGAVCYNCAEHVEQGHRLRHRELREAPDQFGPFHPGSSLVWLQ